MDRCREDIYYSSENPCSPYERKEEKGSEKPRGGLQRNRPSLWGSPGKSQTCKMLCHLLWNKSHGVAKMLKTSNMVTLNALLVLLIKEISPQIAVGFLLG